MHLFYVKSLKKEEFRLENEEFRHCIQVLRKKEGDLVHVSAGDGTIYEVRLNEPGKREVSFEVLSKEKKTRKSPSLHIAIAPTKQMERMEWFVEKACELGVTEITFIKSKNSERAKLKLDRLERKTISALKQSKSGFKTKLNPLTELKEFTSQAELPEQKLIAYVDPEAHDFKDTVEPANTVMLIGPEGDFTKEEVNAAIRIGFSSAYFGENVLRTETAGVFVASVFYYL